MNNSHNKIKIKLTLSIMAVFMGLALVFIIPIVSPGFESSVLSQTEQQLRNKIEELQKKIDDAKNQANTLSREISILENNVQLTETQIIQAQLQIEQKEKELDVLKDDIRLLEIRLNRLDETIDYHEDLLAKRIRQQYVDHQRSYFEMLISSEGISSFLAKLTYLQRVEAQDRELLGVMNDTKGNYEDQQELLKEKKSQVEDIKKEIEAQKAQAESLKASLVVQKQQKANLLSITKNDEKRYKELLEEAEKELQQIQRAANIVIREGKGVHVEKGEVIGTMGNSGYSTGAHLHFGIYGYSKEDFESHSDWGWYYSGYKNPLDYLKSKTVRWDTGCYRDPKGDSKSGSGDWEWPMESPRITQSYGNNTCYNWMYGGKAHPALDMVGIGDISVKAVDDGEAYFCRNCLGDGGNGVFVFHDDSKMSLYWHLK